MLKNQPVQQDVPLRIHGEIELARLVDGHMNGRQEVVGVQKNLVTDLAYETLFPRILGRDPNADIAIISVGEGGNYDAGGVFVGSRVAPATTDTVMRREIFRAGIIQIEFPAVNQVRFTGLLRQAEAVSTSIDEFGLLSTDGRMISHAINADSGPATPTVPYTKPLGAIFVVKWTLTLVRC